MKKFKNFVFSIWSLVSFVILGPILVCGYSLFRAILHGYSVERPLLALLAIAVVAFALYYPMTKAEDMFKFNMTHEFESGHRVLFGGFLMCFIATFPEIEQMREFDYVNHLMFWVVNGWFALLLVFFALVILVFGLGIGRAND